MKELLEAIHNQARAMQAQTEATTKLLSRVDQLLWLLADQMDVEQQPFTSLSEPRPTDLHHAVANANSKTHL